MKNEGGLKNKKRRKLLHGTITGDRLYQRIIRIWGKHYYFLNWIGLFITVLKSIEYKEDFKQILD